MIGNEIFGSRTMYADSVLQNGFCIQKPAFELLIYSIQSLQLNIAALSKSFIEANATYGRA